MLLKWGLGLNAGCSLFIRPTKIVIIIYGRSPKIDRCLKYTAFSVSPLKVIYQPHLRRLNQALHRTASFYLNQLQLQQVTGCFGSCIAQLCPLCNLKIPLLGYYVLNIKAFLVGCDWAEMTLRFYLIFFQIIYTSVCLAPFNI